MANEFVRVTPFDKGKGARAKRVVVGSKLFVSGKWYEMPRVAAEKLRPLRQSTGVPYFDVMSEEEFRETARREVAAAMVASGLAGLAMQGAELPRAVPPPKDGPRTSKFAGLEAAAREVDTSRGVLTSSDVTPEPDEPESESERSEGAPNFDRMTKADLKTYADEQGIEIPSGASAARIRAILRENG